MLQQCENDDVSTTIEEAVDDAAYESFQPEQRDAENCAYGSARSDGQDADDSGCRPHLEQDASNQMTFVQVYGILHSQNPSVACAVLLLRPLAKAAEAHYTVPSPLAIEAHITHPEAPAFRPLIITAAEVHGTLLRTLAIGARIIVPEASAFRPFITTAEILVIEAPVTVPEASAFRPLVIIAAEAQCTVLRPLAIEAPITVPETSAQSLRLL